MQPGIAARVAVAGPVALLCAMVGVAAAAALSNVAQWPLYAVAALLPVALCLWLNQGAGLVIRALLAIATIVVSLGVAAAIVFLLVPFFEIAGVGISGAGVYTLLWGPIIVVLLGSLGVRARSGAPLLGAWLLWWVAVAAGIVWAEPFTYALTDLVGADAMAGTLAVLAAPTLGMSAWVGTVSVFLLYPRLTRGHRTRATT